MADPQSARDAVVLRKVRAMESAAVGDLSTRERQDLCRVLEHDEIGRLAAVPTYAPGGKNKKATVVIFERCETNGGESCPAYLGVKDIVSARQGSTAFDDSAGKVRVARLELTENERRALAPIFPQAGDKPVQAPAAAMAAGSPAPDASPATPLIEVQAIAEYEAHKVLNKKSVVIGNVLVLSQLFIFWGALAGVAAGIYYSRVADPEHRSLVTSTQSMEWLILSAISFVVLVISGYLGLANSGAVGNRYYRMLSRNSIAQRRNKWVDPERPGDLPTCFVQVVPRTNWRRLMVETATDTGFLQIDPRKRELRFEGDVERYRIPISAISSCELERYSGTPNNRRLNYCVVVIQGKTVKGFWEAPISLRPTKWFVPADYRGKTSAEIQGKILELNPPVTVRDPSAPPPIPAPGSIMPLGTPIRAGSPAPVLEAPNGFFRRYGVTLVFLALIITIALVSNLGRQPRHPANAGPGESPTSRP
jgi:hypothetical protein